VIVAVHVHVNSPVDVIARVQTGYIGNKTVRTHG